MSRTAALAEWFNLHRRPLPWRAHYEPYQVWISEVMLQQTQVETVLPYYARFLERFPTLENLASASEDEVLKLWSGLGYYRRARNFRKAAIEVVRHYGGSIPSQYDDLIALPGVGRYMAGAILSIAFNEPLPIVDGNVRRVLSRYNGWREPREPEIWHEAARIVESGIPRVLNQGMMELGATLCTVKAPECYRCPWRPGCVAFADGMQEQIPAPRKRPQTVRVDLAAVIDRNAKGLLMREREGLWEFPMLSELPDGRRFEKVGHCRHAITHHRVEVDVYVGRLGRKAGYRRVRLQDVAVTSLTKKIYRVAESQL